VLGAIGLIVMRAKSIHNYSTEGQGGVGIVQRVAVEVPGKSQF